MCPYPETRRDHPSRGGEEHQGTPSSRQDQGHRYLQAIQADPQDRGLDADCHQRGREEVPQA